MALNGRKTKLNGFIIFDEVIVTSNIVKEEDKEEDKEDKLKKYHFGITAAPIYTSKRVKGNENDNVTISQFNELNTFKSNRTGYSIGLIGTYDLMPKISLLGGIGCTNISDENNYMIVEDVNSPIINNTSSNSMSFSTLNRTEKRVHTSIHYLELDAGVKHIISKRSIYLKETGGVSSLISSKGENSFRNLNYNIAFAIGKEYSVGKIKINIEPEITYYIKSYQSDGDVMAKPTTFGINFIAIR